MSTAPIFDLVMDRAAAVDFDNGAPASAWVPQGGMLRQHALMSGWGGPPQFVALHLDGGDATRLSIQVPPSVVTMAVRVLASGSGTVTITTATDGTGTQLEWDFTGGDGVDDSGVVESIGPLPTSAGASSGRDIGVSSSATWDWQTEQVSIGTVSGDGTVYGLMLIPRFVAL